MGFLSNLNPFRPGRTAEPPPLKQPKFDVDRALEVELREHPTLERRRAANGELILIVQRELHAAEKLLARVARVNRSRRIVLDKYGEFMLDAALKPGARLTDAAEAMAKEFDIDIERARLGVVQLVKGLMLRGFVFLVRSPQSPQGRSAAGNASDLPEA
ncbi:MAG: hypothetical protein GXP31_17700 [Kiritimatiellaeota bacterium]|nr:hypothetical protein [Kiritimatiellota bacterium]